MSYCEDDREDDVSPGSPAWPLIFLAILLLVVGLVVCYWEQSVDGAGMIR